MNRLPAITGLRWLKDGMALFRQRPVELATLLFSYLLLMMAIGIVPVLGQIAPFILMPTFSLAFLRAGALIRAGERVLPRLLFEGFRSPARKQLLVLGLLQAVGFALALAGSALVDGGLLWKIMSGQIAFDQNVASGASMRLAILTSAALSIPASMAFWYAAPLVAWHRMSVGKAMFYSFFAVLREARAFLIYGLGWFAFSFMSLAVASLILLLIFNNPGIVAVILMPLWLLLLTVLYSTFYSTYFDVFGDLETPPQIDIAV